jgi:hypothetical protein
VEVRVGELVEACARGRRRRLLAMLLLLVHLDGRSMEMVYVEVEVDSSRDYLIWEGQTWRSCCVLMPCTGEIRDQETGAQNRVVAQVAQVTQRDARC